MPEWIVSVSVAVALLVVNGLVGLGVEGSKRTKMSGVFAAGWLMFLQGLGFIALWSLDAFQHSLLLGVGFIAIGLGIISLPFVNREFQRVSDGK